MRHVQVCYVATATALLLIFMQVLPAWGTQYKLPSKARYGSNPPTGQPGYYPAGEQDVDCSKAAPLEDYKSTVAGWIHDLTDSLKTATDTRDSAEKNYQQAQKDFYAAAAQKPPNEQGETDAKKRYDAAWASYQDSANQVSYFEAAIKYLQGELKRTVQNYHESCGCRYFCALDYWQCPGSPPPPPAPPPPQNVGGQCR